MTAPAPVREHYAALTPKRRTEGCSCGGEITAETGWEAAAVDEHNKTALHQSWRRRRDQVA